MDLGVKFSLSQLLEEITMFSINQRIISTNHEPFIIAEMSGNHNQSLDRALEIVDAAVAAGADALKLQTYTAETMTLNIDKDEFFVSDESNLWSGQSLHALYEKASTPWEWHERIFEYGRLRGLEVFSTPFDESAVEFLEKLDCPVYKVASFENTDIPLIEAIASTKKPMIISCGMANLDEIGEAVEAARTSGCTELALLKCTSAYPSEFSDSNLLTIPDMKNKFNCEIGLSDHTSGVTAPLVAVALGATIIEKHLTLDRNDGGVDSSFSLEPKEFKLLTEQTKIAFETLGVAQYGTSANEKKSVLYRRSIYASDDIQIGQIFTKQNIRSVRPGLGLPPKYLKTLLGKKSARNFKIGEPISSLDCFVD